MANNRGFLYRFHNRFFHYTLSTFNVKLECIGFMIGLIKRDGLANGGQKGKNP